MFFLSPPAIKSVTRTLWLLSLFQLFDILHNRIIYVTRLEVLCMLTGNQHTHTISCQSFTNLHCVPDFFPRLCRLRSWAGREVRIQTEGEGGEKGRKAAHPGAAHPSPSSGISQSLALPLWGWWHYLARLQTLGLSQPGLSTQRCLV